MNVDVTRFHGSSVKPALVKCDVVQHDHVTCQQLHKYATTRRTAVTILEHATHTGFKIT